MVSFSSIISLGAAISVLVYYFSRSVYRLYFHPLAKYPGPRLAAISELWYARMALGGFWHNVLHDAHLRYGPIVRTAPNELSFSTPQAARDIYGPPSKSRKLFTKNISFYDTRPNPPAFGFMIDPEAHSARRNIFNRGFRTQSLREQEFLIHQHTDVLLDSFARWMQVSPRGIDMTQAWQWLTFDIISHLIFGESFGAVQEGHSHTWVSMLLDANHASIAMALRHRLPFVDTMVKVLPWVSPSARVMLKNMENHKTLTLEKVRKRISMGNVGFDDLLQGALEDGTLSEPDLAAEANVMLVAGAETSATVLACATWYLATNKPALSSLEHEIRQAFPSYTSITGDAVAALPYLNAVIEETMRIFPPVPEGPPRVSPGEFVDGVYVGPGVGVSAHTWYIHNHPDLVPRADEFLPERWIGGGGGGGIGGDGKPFVYPFSIGPRACIGINLAYLEMRIALAKLVYRYDFELSDEWKGRSAAGSPSGWPAQCRVTTLWKKVPLRVKFRAVSAAAGE